MPKQGLEYQRRGLTKPENTAIGWTAVVLSTSAAGLLPIAALLLDYRFELIIIIGYTAANVLPGLLNYVAAISLLLSFVFGSLAWFEGNRTRWLGMWAIAVSSILLVGFAIIVIRHA